MAAVPAAQPLAGAVAGGSFKIRVVSAPIVHSAAPVEPLPLPRCMAGTCPAVGGGLHEPAAHFVHPGDLQLTGGLVDPGQDGTPCRHLQRVGVPAGVGDKGHLLCKAVHAALDGGAVVKGSGGHLRPCPVQLPLKRPGNGVGGGGGQVLPCAPVCFAPALR